MMPILLADTLSTLAALILCVPVFVLPGAGFARWLALPGFDRAELGGTLALSLIASIACLPVLLDLAGRFGPNAMVALTLMLALAGLVALLPVRVALTRPHFAGLACLALWAVFGALMLADWPTAGGLRRSVLMADHVKHVTATWAIADAGTPPYNPTFFTPNGHAAYYYFFYNLTAVVAKLGAWVALDARAAAFASTLIMGPALFALALVLYRQSNAGEAAGAPSPKPLWPFVLALLLATGVDILPVSFIGLISGDWPVAYEQWNDEVTSWLDSVLWVPHHVAGLIACMAGFVALSSGREQRTFDARRILFAALAFASCAGLSIYLAFVAALIAALWFCVLLMQRRTAHAGALIAAGLGALVLAAPWIATLTGAPAGQQAPIAFEIRHFPLYEAFTDGAGNLAFTRLLFLPLSYALEFGVFALGAFAFWKIAGKRGARNDLSIILILCVIASLLVGSFLRSTILFNDLGWRAMLPAQIATLIWTLAAWRGGAFARNGPQSQPVRAFAFIALLMLGYASDIYGVMQLRRNPDMKAAEIAALLDERAAWDWLSRALPARSVVQENPDRTRAYSYGLYGHFPVALSDRYNGLLFGASRADVAARMSDLAPLFADPNISLDDARTRARRYNIDAMIVTALDPAFTAAKWTSELKPAYANAHVRIYAFTERLHAP